MEERKINLTEEQLDRIVNKVADEVFNRIYTEIGRSIVKKLFWIAGVSIFAVFVFLASKGMVKV